MLKESAGKRLKYIEAKIIKALKESSSEDGSLIKMLADLLSKHHLGTKNKKDIAKKLNMLADYFKSSCDFYKARDYLDAAEEWYKKLGDLSQSTI